MGWTLLPDPLARRSNEETEDSRGHSPLRHRAAAAIIVLR